MKSKALFILLLLLTLGAAAYGQEQPLLSEAEEDPAGEKLTHVEKRQTELEIKSSTLPELAAWCRELGLSEGGTKEELAARIREHFRMEPPKIAEANQKLLVIESAQSTEYFKIQVTDEDYARLKGDVRLILYDKEDVHKIKADEVLFNRTRNIITARGKVEYRKEKGGTTEIFRGENITVNIDDWDSVFLDGDSEKTLESENTAYRFEGTVISRGYDDVMILKQARISNANNEEALWSISASKLFLLPGSDFAIFNAVLKVGEIPVLYFPFFYYSADDLIFHPVIGYRTREGGFVQTSTYIMGRPKADTTEKSSITRILGSAEDMEKVHNGIFLRSTGKKATNTNATTLKLMADYYVNLGAYTGVDFSLPQKGIFNSFDLSLGAGFSRTLTMVNGNYTPYAPDYDGSVEWNNSSLLSKTVPFRYRFKTQSSVRGKYGGFSWDIPYYSDPYIDRDFYLKRAEAMDWVNMMQQGTEFDEDITTVQDIGDYKWQLSGNISPSTESLSPYITNMSLNNLSTTLAFKTIRNDAIYYTNTEHPGRHFFAPDKYTIYSASGSVSGTPLTVGKRSGSSGVSVNTNTDAAQEEPEGPLKGIGIPRPPWEDAENKTGNIKSEDLLTPPALNKTFDLPRTGNNIFSIGYQLTPAGSSELQFRSGYGRWKTSKDINWNEVQSVLSNFKGNGNLSFNLKHSEGMYTNTLTFSGNGTWQDYNYLNDEAEAYRTPQDPTGAKDENRIDAAKKQQYAQTNYSSSYAYNTTFKPVYRDPVFGQSNLQYDLGGTLVKSKKYSNGDGPELTPVWGTFRRERIKDGEEILGLRSHRLTSNFAANIMDKQQNLTISTDLPPLEPLVQTNATARFWISETNARIDFKKPEMWLGEPNNEWRKDPFHLTETLRFADFSTAIFYMVIEPEDDYHVTTVTSSLTLWGFKASFSAVKLHRWEYVPDDPDFPQLGKWEQRTDEKQALRPRDLIFSYAKSTNERELVKNRLGISMNVNTSLTYDLQRYTNSNFQFTAGFTLKINKFLDFSLSGTSENAVVFRYFKNVPGMENSTRMYFDGPQNNIITDFFDSFNFFDDAKRQRSGFKMKQFNLKTVHHLGDWDATLDVAISPYLDSKSTPPKYDINTVISFLVKWSAISEIKTDLKYEKRTEKWTKN
jgi:lipopolysaccharide assembly outer membrane protein LptD (OstA)